MKDKMRRFLNHIHIEDIDAFDMDFEMVNRNRFNYQQIDMIIVKNTPWEYDLLRTFIDGLGTIDYPYTLHFSYLQAPTASDAIRLFSDWYRFILLVLSSVDSWPISSDVSLSLPTTCWFI